MYLDSLGGLQRLLRGDAHLPLPQQLLGEVGDVAASDGDVLDAAANDVALSLEHTGVGQVEMLQSLPSCPSLSIISSTPYFLSLVVARMTLL